MDDDEVVEHFSDVIENEHEVIRDRQTKLDLIEDIESALEGNSWRSDSANKHMSELYNDLAPSERSQVLSEKKDLESLKSKEESARSSLRQSLKAQMPPDAVGVLNSPTGVDFLSKIDAKVDNGQRDRVKTDVLDALEKLRLTIRDPNFDVSKSAAILNGTDETAVREYAAEFVWQLRENGWIQEDIEEIPDEMDDVGTSLSSYIVYHAIKEKEKYTAIVFVPGLNIEVSPQTIRASETTLYPAGPLSANVVPHLAPLISEFKVELTYHLHHSDAIGFEVTTFTRNHADKKAVDRTTEFISELSSINPERTLSLPQHYNTFQKFIKRKNHKKVRFKTEFSYEQYNLYDGIIDNVAEFQKATHGSSMTLMTGRLLNATRFFRRANSPGPQIDGVINSVIAIEAAVSRGYTNQKEITELAMDIAGTYPSARERVKSSYKLLYQVRNEAVHSGNTDSVSVAAVDSALSTVNSQLIAILQRIAQLIAETNISTLDELEQRVRGQKRGQFASNAAQLRRDGIDTGTPYRFNGKLVKEDGRVAYNVNGVLYIQPDYPEMQFHIALRDVRPTNAPVDSREDLELRTSINHTDIGISGMNSMHLMFSGSMKRVKDSYTTY